MGEQPIWHDLAGVAHRSDGTGGMDGVSGCDCRRDQGAAARTALVRFGRAIAQGAEAMEANRAGKLP